MKFEDIPFSDYETQLFTNIGAWKSYDELEDCFTLDELLITHKALLKKQSQEMKIAALSAGASDIEWDEPDIFDDSDDGFDESEYPEEFWEQNNRVLEAKRESQRGMGFGTEAGQVGVYGMAPDLAAKIQEMVKGLG